MPNLVWIFVAIVWWYVGTELRKASARHPMESWRTVYFLLGGLMIGKTLLEVFAYSTTEGLHVVAAIFIASALTFGFMEMKYLELHQKGAADEC